MPIPHLNVDKGLEPEILRGIREMTEEKTTGNSGVVAIQPPALQFRLSTIFVLTLIATLLAAFLNPRGSDLLLAGAITVTSCLVIALIIGKLFPPLVDRVFWGVVVAAMMQAVTAYVTLLDRAGIFAWPIVAGLAAIVAAGQSNLYRRMLLAAITGGTAIVPYVVPLSFDHTVTAAFVVCAAIGGALLAAMVDTVRWLEKRYRISQPVIGLTLVVGAMAFSYSAKQLVWGW